MTLASIASLLQAALSLLLLVQSNSSLPPSLIGTAEQTAQQAINEATTALSAGIETQASSSSTNGPVSFSASPPSGSAPLTTSFNASGPQVAQGDTINFGDGSTGSLQINYPPCAYGTSCPARGFASHTYQSAGTYTATLYGPQPYCPAGSGITCVASQPLGTATVTVSSGTTQSVSFSATPRSGQTPLSVTFSASGTNLGSGDTVNFGDGTSGTLALVYPPCAYGTTCPVQGSASHTYQSAGTYTATLNGPVPYCPAGTSDCTTPVLGSITITVTAAQTQSISFTATPTSGPVPDTVTFSASGLNPSASYNIDFGDGSSGQLSVSIPYCPAGSSGCLPEGSASHTYQSPGTYTAQLSLGCASSVACPTAVVASAQIQANGFSGTLAPPSGLSSTCSGNMQATATWNPVSGASTYLVYLYDQSVNTWDPVVDTAGQTSDTATVTPEHAYEWVIRSANGSAGLVSQNTASLVFTCAS